MKISGLNLELLEQRIPVEMEQTGTPALAIGIVQGDKVIYARGFGTTSVEDGFPVTPTTIFRIGSTTKPLVGTAIMRLVSKGILELDRPVREYVQWLRLSDPLATERLTLRMLINQSSGLPTSYSEYGPRDPETLGTTLQEELPTLAMLAPPGTLYTYSNPGLRLAGYVAEVVTGKSFSTVMQELVFKPLAMTRTTFDPLIALTYPMALPHERDTAGQVKVIHRFPENAARYPAGLAMSTIQDLANFAIVHLNHGTFQGDTFLSAEAIEAMHAPHVDLYRDPPTGYGFTFRISDYKGVRRVEHGGAHSSYGCHFVLMPDSQNAVILLHNFLPHFSRVSSNIVDTILDEVLNLSAIPAVRTHILHDRSRWPLYTGSYLGATVGLITITVEKDKLILSRHGIRRPLQAIRRDLYAASDTRINSEWYVGFVPNNTDPSTYLMFESQVCRRYVHDPSFVPVSQQWTSYVGTYRIDMGAVLTVRLDGENLRVHFSLENQTSLCVPLTATRFASDFGVLDFILEPNGTTPSICMGGSFMFYRVNQPDEKSEC